MAKIKRSKQDYPGISVYKRRDLKGSWAAQWRDPITGQKHQTLLSAHGYSTKAEAAGFLQSLSENFLERKHQKTLGRTSLQIETEERGKVPLLTVLESFEEAKSQGKSVEIVKNLQTRLRPVKDWLGGPGIGYTLGRDFNKLAIIDFHDWLQLRKRQRAAKAKKRGKYESTDAELSATTKNIYRATTITFLNWARKRGHIQMDALDISEAFEKFKSAKTRPVALKPDELARLLTEALKVDSVRCHGSRVEKSAYYSGVPSDSAKPKYLEQTPLLLFLMLTGLRLGEACHIRWADVDFRDRTIRVKDDPISGWKVKTREERDIWFDDCPALDRLLQILKARPDPGEYIMRGISPSKPREFHRPSWDRFADRAKLHRASPKVLRSTFATAVALGQTGTPTYVLAARMGHSVEVAESHYVNRAKKRPGNTVEEWLGISDEVRDALKELESRNGN